jgi:hypothetical protein
MRLRLARRSVVVLALCAMTTGLIGLQPAEAQFEFHGITPQKFCESPTKVGDPLLCAFRITNADDNDENIVVSSVVDTVAAAAGAVSSGNIIDSLVWTTSGGASCTAPPNRTCTLPDSGDFIESALFTHYTVQPGDYDIDPVGHILARSVRKPVRPVRRRRLRSSRRRSRRCWSRSVR